MKLIKLLLITVLAISILFAQEADHSYTFGRYFFWDHGIGSGSFRDEGTSALTYTGIAARLGTGYLSEQTKYSFEFRMNANYIGGFLDQGYFMNNLYGDIQLSYLRSIPAFKNEQLSLKAGGKVSTTFSASMNDSYQNASFNFDFFSSINARGQLSYTFIKPEKQKKRRTVPERRYALICKLDIPLMHLNVRPEFAYVIDGNMTSLERLIFVGGYGIQSNIALKQFFMNGNAFEISYIWRMFSTGNRDIYKLEQASHIFQFSYFFKLD